MKRPFAAIAVVLFVPLASSPARASDPAAPAPEAPPAATKPSSTEYLGYIATIPKQWFGLWGGVVWPRGGFLVDIKLPVDDPSRSPSYQRQMTVQIAEDLLGDERLRSSDIYTTINAAYILPRHRRELYYIGAGVSIRETFHRYWDETLQLGSDGYYWVKDEEASGTGLNLIAGALVPFGTVVVIRAGGQLRPTGVDLGVGLSF